ncbi:MAG: protein translocase SEC61 complex subunit gamma [Thermoplasmata archaeon]|nr:protein translocase SEC61 complex subunit gamma [Thermoplasmata archaeon]
MDLLKKTWSETWDKSWKYQKKIESKIKNVGRGKYGRVLKMSRKPTSDEYSKTLIITGIGIVLIGGLGFGIYLLWEYFGDFVNWAFGL